MKRTIVRITCVLVLVILVAGLHVVTAGQAASSALSEPDRSTPNPNQDHPPVVISDSGFNLHLWEITEQVTGSASFTASQQQTDGNPGAFLFMSHRLPPVSDGNLANRIAVTYVYQAFYTPFVQGEIRAIDYAEDGIILSFPVPDSFSTTIPIVVQDGRIFRTERFLRFIAQDGRHSWERKALTGLTAADFIATDGSGDHPNFIDGSSMRFGFIRSNSRTTTLPPVPPDQDLVIDQGVDNWRITIHRDNTNRPPKAVDDVFILDGYRRTLPVLELFDVLRNDTDPNPRDIFELVAVTTPAYGTAEIFVGSLVAYRLAQARATDSFSYTISDGDLTSSARVDVYFDCACTVLCLNQLGLPFTQATDHLDLPLIYRVRDQVLKPTPHGRRYVDMYYTNNPEILVKILTHGTLRTEAIATVQLWQDNLRSLVDGDGSAIISQAQVTAMKSFLNHLWAVGSNDLRQIIGDELERLGPLDEYVGLTMKEAKSRAIGDPVVYLPSVHEQ